jgi:hypothetical protein
VKIGGSVRVIIGGSVRVGIGSSVWVGVAGSAWMVGKVAVTVAGVGVLHAVRKTIHNIESMMDFI